MPTDETHWWLLRHHLTLLDDKVERILLHMATVSEDVAALVAADGALQTSLTAALADFTGLIAQLKAGVTVTPAQIAQLESTTADLQAASAALASADPGPQVSPTTTPPPPPPTDAPVPPASFS
jgi:hypothetical protein